MEATCLVQKLNIRSSMQVTPTNDVGDLYAGDKVYGAISGNWIAFKKVYRTTGEINIFEGNVFAAVANPSNANEKFLALKDVPEPSGSTPSPTPAPTPALPEVTISMTGNYDVVRIDNDGASVTVVLTPKQ